MPEVKVTISTSKTFLNVTEAVTEIILGNTGPQGPAGFNAADITAVLPATWDANAIEVGVDQDAFDHISNLDYAQFDITDITGSDAVGRLAWSVDNETLEVQLDDAVVLQLGQENLIRVKNNSGSVAIPKFTLVMFAGATGDTVKVSPAITNGSVPHEYMVGVTAEVIPADGFGFVTTDGFINGVNTNSYALGAILYADPATPGGFTTTKPAAPNLKLPIAAVTRVNASSGRVLVRMFTGLTLNELHDVQTNGKSDGDTIVWDAAQNRWENSAYDYADLANIPSTFTPSAHASTHGSAGSDPVTLSATQVSGTAIVKNENLFTLNGTAVAFGGSVTISGGGGTSFTVDAPITFVDDVIGIDQTALAINPEQVNGTAVIVSDLSTATVGTAGYATLAGTADYATVSESADTAGTASYATTSGTAVYAETAGTATPSAHAATHGSAGSDAITISNTQVTGTAVTLVDTATVTNTMLVNSSITLNGSAVSLGGTATLSGMALLDSQTFSSSTTYTMPTGALAVIVECISAGGGGGGGARNTSTLSAGGGGGGSGGGFYSDVISASTIGTAVTVTIGAGGLGGSGRAGSTGEGLTGNGGGNSRFANLYYLGGRLGIQGSTSAGGAAGNGYLANTSAVGTSAFGAGGAGNTTTSGSVARQGFRGGGGGGGGGGRSSIDRAGGAGGLSSNSSILVDSNLYAAPTGEGGAGGLANGGNGTGGTASSGGGGGGSSNTAAGGNGGNGATPGGGGGGGAGANGDQNGGNGGNGGDAQIKIWVFG